MAFGNATIGDLKKIAGGGGGGGTKDYTELTNKPSINGIELLAGTEIGKLSGDIKVTLSAIDNVDIRNATQGQTLLLNSLGKWTNSTPSKNVEVIHYVGDDTRSRVHMVGQYSALKVFGILNTGYTESSWADGVHTYYWADFNANKTGSIAYGNGSVSFSADNAGIEFNAAGVDYYIIVIR